MVTTKTAYGNIRPTQIEDEMRSSYLDYAMSVIVSRALPDVRDGLKPVQRRILYAMHELGMRPNSAYKKSARLVGEVLGKYHPHNDAAVYDAMVRMAQSWSMRLPLVDGQGNFGSVDGDPPAALRYTEARLATPAEEMLANLDQDTVDFIDNFDGSLREPVVLPARLPNLLINGASGIAVGMATNIPPHNPAEVCDAIIQLIDKPDSTPEDLMRHVKGPDFPTGGTIMGREGIRNAYISGRGQIIMRATAEVEETQRSRRLKIVVSELPYQVNKATLVEKIAQLAKDKRIDGISEIRDESNRVGMRVVIELRGGVQPMVVLNNLYKLTAMQSTFSANMLALVGGTPETITLKAALQNFIAFREQVVVRRTEYDLKRARERAHILAGLRIAIGNLDRVIQLIRNSADADAARNGLINEFGLDDVQARAILDMQLRRIATLERERLETEYRELQESIRGMEELLASPSKIFTEVKKETRKLKKTFGESRRTEISNEGHDISREELEPHEQLVVTFSQAGYIKRIAADTYRNQHRGGKGVTSMNTKDDDPVRHILVVDSHDRLLFFTNTGRILSIKAYELRADTSRNTRGTPSLQRAAHIGRRAGERHHRRRRPGRRARLPGNGHEQGQGQACAAQRDFYDSTLWSCHYEAGYRRRAGDRATCQRRRPHNHGNRRRHVHSLPRFGRQGEGSRRRRHQGHGLAKGEQAQEGVEGQAKEAARRPGRSNGRGHTGEQAAGHRQARLRQADRHGVVPQTGQGRQGNKDASHHRQGRRGC